MPISRSPERGADVARALAYHERTKHYPGRYARSLGYLDWETQPDPFRRFDGAPIEQLERPAMADAPSLDALYALEIAPAPIDRRSISQLFFDSLAISAWKQGGKSRWSLRCNPSSGNLHPTEAYLIDGAVWHYQPRSHSLERRRDGALPLPPGTLLVALTSIHWREAWKYGERAYRYCQHDVGHAIAAIAYAAAALGWRVRALLDADDGDLEALLGLDAQHGASPRDVEREHADVLLGIFAGDVVPIPLAPIDGPPLGAPNALSEDHHFWPAIDEVSAACRRTHRPRSSPPAPTPQTRPIDRALPARRIFRQRRSAVDMDGATSIDRDAFHRMLLRLDPGWAPLSALPWEPRVHAAIFVHRVDGMEPGLYLLVRRAGAIDELRAAMHPDFEWAAEPLDGVTLYRLAAGDVRGAARLVMCDQEIAKDGAFAVAFVGELEPTLEEDGAWRYRAIHWEAGLLGHVLYLEAEAASVRATGIGCFFDDVLHELLGLEDPRFQMIYGLSVGGALDDPRVLTLDAYP